MSTATLPTEPLPVPPTLRIGPRKGWQPIDFGELWRYRELLWFLALRDIKVRYKQTMLGATWAILQPLMTMIVFNALFSLMGNKPSGDLPYPIATFAALLPWQLFANVLSQSGNSLISNQNLITKVYFPRLIIPASTVVAALVDFFIAFLVLLGMMAWYGIWPSWAMLTLPAFLLLAVAVALAVGLWLSALNVKYRDFRYVIPFLIQIWMFVSPVVYTTAAVIPEKWQAVYGLNPMAGVIEGFRWALLGNASALPGASLWVSVIATAVLLVGGLYYFRRMESYFADLA